jgi:hypothetical protein
LHGLELRESQIREGGKRKTAVGTTTPLTDAEKLAIAALVSADH